MMQRKKNRIAQTMSSVRDRVMGTAHGAKESLSETSDNAADAVKHAPDMVAERTAGAPMVAGGISFGIGMLIAVAFPATQAEEKAGAKLRDTIEQYEASTEELKARVAIYRATGSAYAYYGW